jgi:hypothetical protein
MDCDGAVGRTVLTHTFKGKRFNDHGLSVDVLEELIVLKKLLVEIASELWRRKNPERKRLPAGFSELDLKFYEIRSGSAQVELKRQNSIKPAFLALMEASTDEDVAEADEIDEAANMISGCIRATAEGRMLPDAMPKEQVPKFALFGKTLRSDESFEISTPGVPEPARYDAEIRMKLIEWQPSEYEDRVFIVGELRKADIDGCQFRLRTDANDSIDGRYSPDKQAMILEALYQHESKKLKLLVRASFDAFTKTIKRITEVEDYYLVVPEEQFDPTAPPIWEVLQGLSSEIPDDFWLSLPSDLAANFDQYSTEGSRSAL